VRPASLRGTRHRHLGTAIPSKTPIAYGATVGGMSLPLLIVGHNGAHECRQFQLGKFEVFEVGGQVFGRAVYEPGWRWSQHVGPGFGAAWCAVEHIGFVLAGRAAVKMTDGTELAMGAGDWFSIPAGHDSWVLGDEQYISLHLLGARSYAAPADTPETGDHPRRTLSPVSTTLVPSSTSAHGYEGRTLLARPEIHVMEGEMNAGIQEQRHIHDRTTHLYYFLSGQAVVEIDGIDVGAEAGQAIEIDPGQAHQITNDSDTALRFLVISSGPPRLDRHDLK
jgi:mannose-6-phosphate isomerase-like protein (cupin superfamily)